MHARWRPVDECGSGLSDHQFRAAVAGGIQKVNIFANLAIESKQRMIENAQTENASLFSLTAQIREAFRDECERLLDVFGTAGKA